MVKGIDRITNKKKKNRVRENKENKEKKDMRRLEGDVGTDQLEIRDQGSGQRRKLANRVVFMK